jgi:hypothetical protein
MTVPEKGRYPRRVSKRQAALYAGIDPRTLDNLIADGVIGVYYANKRVQRIDLDELDSGMRIDATRSEAI